MSAYMYQFLRRRATSRHDVDYRVLQAVKRNWCFRSGPGFRDTLLYFIIGLIPISGVFDVRPLMETYVNEPLSINKGLKINPKVIWT